ncbi:MAG: PH domain-containing protein [bacterium]|nr:PH domain-containing protein [bacterium]
MKKLHPNALALFYLTGVIVWLFILAIFVGPLLVVLTVEGTISAGILFIIFFFGLAIILLLPLPFSYWSYQNYKYELQADRISIEKGVIWKKYVSIPYERVQNVDIIRGPLARMLGLSDLQIQTAGASTNLMIEGRIPGITFEEANKLKDEILSKVSKKKNQGL